METTESDDTAILNQPIEMSKPGIHQIMFCMTQGSREIRNILMRECNVVYECKICRSLFRSLANFIYHKRYYCKEHCCERMKLFSNEDLPQEEDIIMLEPKSPEESDNDVAGVAVNNEDEANGVEQTEVGKSTPKIYVPCPKKDSVSDKKIGEGSSHQAKFYQNCLDEIAIKSDRRRPPVTLNLTKIDSNKNAVMQSMMSNADKHDDEAVDDEQSSMAEHEEDIDDKEQEMMESFGDNERQQVISCDFRDLENKGLTVMERLNRCNECNVNALKCNLCNIQYSTLKTLYFHMTTRHVPNRMYYPCPYCSATFAQMWGVSRHLIKAHKKTNDQVANMRQSIRQKGFMKKISPASNIEVCSEEPILHKCPKCGRMFSKHRYMMSHLKYCKAAKTKVGKSTPVDRVTDEHNVSSVEPIADLPESSKSELDYPELSGSTLDRPKRVRVQKKVAKDFVNSQTLNWRTGTTLQPTTHVQRSSPAVDVKSTASLNTKLTSFEENEKKVISLLNIKRLTCKRCYKHYSSISNLRRHVAIHVGWSRFKCKFCAYQSYNRSDCRLHMLRQHAQMKLTEEKAEKLVVDLKEFQQTSTKQEVEENKNKSEVTGADNCQKNKATESSKSPTFNPKLQLSSFGKSSAVNPKRPSPPNAESQKKSAGKDSVHQLRASSPGVRASKRLNMEINDCFRDFTTKLVTRSASYTKADMMSQHLKQTTCDVDSNSGQSTVSLDETNCGSELLGDDNESKMDLSDEELQVDDIDDRQCGDSKITIDKSVGVDDGEKSDEAASKQVADRENKICESNEFATDKSRIKEEAGVEPETIDIVGDLKTGSSIENREAVDGTSIPAEIKPNDNRRGAVRPKKTNDKKTSSKKRTKSPWLVTRRKRVRPKKADVRNVALTNHDDVRKKVAWKPSHVHKIKKYLVNSGNSGSSDESELRVSKRKQSFSNVLIDSDETSIAGGKLSRSSSLTNLCDSPKKMSSPLSRTNPNSPMRGADSNCKMLVISDEQGRVVREVKVEVGQSPKCNRKSSTNASPSSSKVAGTALKFDNPAMAVSRRYTVGLLRKLAKTSDDVKNVAVEVKIEAPSSAGVDRNELEVADKVGNEICTEKRDA